MHEALAQWYGHGFDRGIEPAKFWEDWAEDEVRVIKANLTERDRQWFEEPVYEEAGELGSKILQHYVYWFEDDPNLEVIAIEQPFEIELVWNDEVIAEFDGRFDGVFLDHEDGEFYLFEHKTAASIRTAHLPLDDQAGGYYAVATHVLFAQGLLGANEHINGSMYNFLRKAKPDMRERNDAGAYLNKNGDVSKRQPPEPFHREFVDRSPREVNQQLRRLTDEVRVMNAMRDGTLPVTKSVTNMCPNCPFFEMCVLHERGGNAWREFRDMNYAVEDPYADHRKSAAE